MKHTHTHTHVHTHTHTEREKRETGGERERERERATHTHSHTHTPRHPVCIHVSIDQKLTPSKPKLTGIMLYLTDQNKKTLKRNKIIRHPQPHPPFERP